MSDGGHVWAEMWIDQESRVRSLAGTIPGRAPARLSHWGIEESLGVPGVMAFSLAILAWLAAVEGREAEAREDAARADDLAQRGLGHSLLRARLQATLGLLEMGLARPLAAIEKLGQVAVLAERHGVREPIDLDEHFGAALELHEQGAGSAFDRARTELLYGERLRRAKRRVDAREHLRSAIELFDGLGAAPWSEQARRELRASGESISRRDPTAPRS